MITKEEVAQIIKNLRMIQCSNMFDKGETFIVIPIQVSEIEVLKRAMDYEYQKGFGEGRSITMREYYENQAKNAAYAEPNAASAEYWHSPHAGSKQDS